jgi:hypothetical protein
MPETSCRTRLDELRAEIETLLARFDWSVSPAFGEAIQAFLTAMDYEDPTLMRSHLATALEALRDLTHDSIRKRLGWPIRVKEAWGRIWERLKECPSESYDEVGREMDSALGQLLKSLTDLRDGAVQMLREHGYEVDNATALESDIEELKSIKDGILESWPWSDRALPPVNRDMVAASRAAIARHEGESIEDLIHRLGGDPTRDS